MSPQMTREDSKEDLDYVSPLCDLQSTEFVAMPKVLNKPVCNLQERLDEIGLLALTEELPIQEHMASFLQYSVEDYHDQIYQWLRQYDSDLPIIGKWLTIHGLDLLEYLVHLSQGGSSDGLELWSAAIALGQHFNVMFESSVWLTAKDGVDEANTWLCLTSYDKAVLCQLKVQDSVDEMGLVLIWII